MNIESVERDEFHEELDNVEFTGRFTHKRAFETLNVAMDPVHYQFHVDRVKICSSHRHIQDHVPTKWQVYLTDELDCEPKLASIDKPIRATAYGMDTDPTKEGHRGRGPTREGRGEWMEVFYMARSPERVFSFEGSRDHLTGDTLTFSFIEPRSRLVVDTATKILPESNSVLVYLSEHNNVIVKLVRPDDMMSDFPGLAGFTHTTGGQAQPERSGCPACMR